MNTFKQSAIEILRKAKTPLHYNEITKQALESGILETEGANPERTMNAVITVDINTKAEGSDFVRAERGVFALNQNKKEIKLALISAINATASEKFINKRYERLKEEKSGDRTGTPWELNSRSKNR